MPLTVVLTCGPRGAGKTALIELIGGELLDHAPHHVRLFVDGENGRSGPPPDAAPPAHMASSVQVCCRQDNVMDVLVEVLRDVRQRERYATVLVEGDCARSLRNAFPYDHHVFVMPAPGSVHEVFRRPTEAAHALQEVMQDTEAFAAEMFGLLLEESSAYSPDAYAPIEKRRRSERSLNADQVRRFLRTPLGAEIASRIQLQPAFQGLAESDVTIINTSVGADTAEVDDCVHRIEMLMSRIHHDNGPSGFLFCCDPTDRLDPVRPKLLSRLADLCVDPF